MKKFITLFPLVASHQYWWLYHSTFQHSLEEQITANKNQEMTQFWPSSLKIHDLFLFFFVLFFLPHNIKRAATLFTQSVNIMPRLLWIEQWKRKKRNIEEQKKYIERNWTNSSLLNKSFTLRLHITQSCQLYYFFFCLILNHS